MLLTLFYCPISFLAAYALGNISVGNLAFFLPLVLREIQSHVKRQYLLLHSLKEIINCQVRPYFFFLFNQFIFFSYVASCLMRRATEGLAAKLIHHSLFSAIFGLQPR